MNHKYLKHKIIIVFLFFLFVVVINQHIYQEGIIDYEKSTQMSESEIENDRLRRKYSQYLEAKMKYEQMTIAAKQFISEFNTFREKILTIRNKANDLRRQAAMAKERNQPNWKEFSTHLINQEKQVRIELETLIVKYTDDVKLINEIQIEIENARVNFVNLEKEVSKINIGALSNT
jgi:hypothetical protein